MNQTTKKIISALILTFFILPTLVLAANSANPLANLDSATPSLIKQPSLPKMVGEVIKSVLSIIGVLMVCYLVYAGFIWTTAGGDSSKVTKAIGIIRSSIIGTLIVLTSYAITSFVVNSLSKDQ